MAIEIIKRPFERVFSGNTVHYQLYSALAASDSTVSFEVRVRFKKIGPLYTYENVLALPYAPVAGYANVDLKEILDSILEFDLPNFPVDETTPVLTDKQTGKFYLQYREITSLNPDPDWDDSESDFECFVIKGGLNDFKYQGNNFWLNFYDVKKPFLTWQPSGTRLLDDGRTEPARLVAIGERMYLAWLVNSALAGASIKARIYYTDGTSAVTTVGIPVSTPRIGCIYYLPAGCTQLGLNNVTPAKTIWYWTIQVVDVNTNTELSEIFKYELDNRNDYIGITLNYRNSLGGLDSQRVRGSIEKKLSYNYSELERTIEPDYFDAHYFSPQKVISGNIEQVVYSGNLGLLRKEEQERLRDAQMIRETWMEKNKKWVPLNIITKDFSLVKNDDQRWSMPIEFTLGYAGSEYYTPDNIDLGEGVFTNNVCRAFMSPMSVVRDPITADNAWVINGNENDPQNASDQVRYRVVKDSDGSVAVDWTDGDWGLPLPFNVPNDTGMYTVEVQAICTNNVYGRKSTAHIDSTSGSSGGGGGGSLFSSITNTTSFGGDYLIDIDSGADGAAGTIGAHNEIAFDVTNVTDVMINVTLTFSASLVTLESGGVAYSGSFVGGVWMFVHVNIIDGIRVFVY